MADTTTVRQWAVDAADEIHEKYILEYDPPQYAPSSSVIASIIDRHAEQHEAKRLSYAEAQRDRLKAALREIYSGRCSNKEQREQVLSDENKDLWDGDTSIFHSIYCRLVARDALKELEADDAP